MASALTAQDLDNRVLARIDNNTALYQTVERYRAINEAIRILNLFTAYLQSTVSVPGWSISNRFYYEVPQGLIIPIRVQFENTYLNKTNLNDLGRSYKNWTTQTTANTMMPVTYWLPIGIRKFAIWPADSLGGRQILVTGVQEPPLLVSPTDVTPFPNQLLSAFDTLAVHTLQLKESSQDFAKSAGDYKKFLSMVKDISVWRGLIAPRFFIEEAEQPVKR